MQLFKHYSDYTGPWPWANFAPAEVACKHCGELALDVASLDALQALRTAWGRAVVVTCGHRCKIHNKKVGGVDGSEHLGLAFDCACPAEDQPAFVEAAKKAGFTGIGLYPKRGFVHLDKGRARTWSENA